MTHTPIKSVDEIVDEFYKEYTSMENEQIWSGTRIGGYLRAILTSDRQNLLSVIEEWGEERNDQDLLTFLKTLK